jgi:uncharacterized protein YeaO (DUF488 family)
MLIRIKRIYDPPSAEDGQRFIVDGLWPRGLKKDFAHLDGWLKEVAPSDALRHWFAHDLKKWREFKRRYNRELRANAKSWEPLLAAAR